MSGYVLIALLLVCATLTTGQKSKAENEGGNPSLLDNFDVEAVLKNERVLKNYVKCVLGNGPCTSEGREMKRVIPDVLKTSCAKCTDQHKDRLRKVLTKLKNDPKLKPEYVKVVDKYDPKKEYVGNLEKFLLA